MKAYAKIVVMATILAITLVMFVATTYAWFVRSENTKEVVINTGFLLTDTDFYYDKDGTWEAKTSPISIKYIVPGVDYTFKLHIHAVGNVDGHLSIYINKFTVDDIEFLKCFDVSYVDPTDSSNKSINLYDMFTFTDGVVTDKTLWFSLYTLLANDDATASPTDDDTLDFVFTITANGDLLGNDYKNKVLDIDQLAIKLEQIPNE